MNKKRTAIVVAIVAIVLAIIGLGANAANAAGITTCQPDNTSRTVAGKGLPGIAHDSEGCPIAPVTGKKIVRAGLAG